MYSGDKPLGLFADRLEDNLDALNAIYDHIVSLFISAGIANFAKLPDEVGNISDLRRQDACSTHFFCGMGILPVQITKVRCSHEVSERAQFAKHFKQFNNRLEAAKTLGKV